MEWHGSSPISRISTGEASFDDLLHELLAAHERGDAEPILQAIEMRLMSSIAVEDIADALQWALLLFDDRCSENVHSARTERAALILLETVAGDDAAWSQITTEPRWEKVEMLLAVSLHPVDLLEPMLFAPPGSAAGDFARQRLRSLGIQKSSDWVLSRRIERLLHIFECREIAYEVEHARKAATATSASRDGEVLIREEPLLGLRVLIAGGHVALRAALGRDLARSGVRQVRELPSRQEASRRERDVSDLMRSSDVALVCTRQIAHSTSDQVKRAGARFEVPVLLSRAAAPTGLRRDLEIWARARKGMDSE